MRRGSYDLEGRCWISDKGSHFAHRTVSRLAVGPNQALR